MARGRRAAADRAVDMLIAKATGQPYQSELIIPKKDLVPIAPALKDLKHARIALANTGGIVPVDNPDRIQSASATRWGRYDYFQDGPLSRRRVQDNPRWF